MTSANTFVHLEHLHRLVQHVKAAAKSLRELESEKLPESVLAFSSYLAKKGSAQDSRAFLAAADELREMDLNYSVTVLEAFVADLEPHLVNALSRIESHFGPQTANAESDSLHQSQFEEGDVALEGTITVAELARLAKESGLIVEDDIDETRVAMDDMYTSMDELALEDMGDDDMDLYSIDDDTTEDIYDDPMDGEDFENSDEVMDFEDDVYNSYASRIREVQPASRQGRQSSHQTKRRTRRINYV